ncbi:MAG: hypothetical protein PVJ09_01730 [Candidatus Woesebacteria bacterium]|jgi:hypothetical protein
MKEGVIWAPIEKRKYRLPEPACLLSEERWLDFLLWELDLATRPVVREITVASFSNLKLRYQIGAIHKKASGERSFLCLTGPWAGGIAADAKSAHRDLLIRKYKLALTDEDAVLMRFMLTRPILKPTFLTELQKHKLNIQDGTEWYIPLLFLLLDRLHINVDTIKFIHNVTLYQNWLDRKFGR